MEQLNRAKRYLKRIERLYAGVFSSMAHDEEEYFDDVLSFFIHCYHVRDWALHQAGAVLRAREIDAFIDLNEPLRICTDLANGSKHCKLMRTPRSGHQPTISQPQKLYSTWFIGDGGGEVLQCSYRVESNGKSFDVRELACECITLWEMFLNCPRLTD
ncbi:MULTISPECIES: hypothetical protein [Pseudomonas]|jgi:hypothetical protein|uniref:Uncharacterized protein n=1 Tax=Pseudomonas granadensis TaxID=1421430 RepID=A0ABX7G9Y1_9PSED|nr:MULTISPECIES: hypothetical protein [Pseudomonas]MBD8597666.1 hypothetical protein [Pseudomonas sp. CFBP 8772]MCS3468993.1 hypothetical protein [Pseudomonas sp. JUb42]MDF3189166.1 hypothetical protein [Pseudomonas paracarnis]QRK81891.1 hypothetical protein JN757_15035 [Pseudomonas granadensis]